MLYSEDSAKLALLYYGATTSSVAAAAFVTGRLAGADPGPPCGRPQGGTNLVHNPRDWDTMVKEFGWDKYPKRFERLFRIGRADFDHLAQRLAAARPPRPPGAGGRKRVGAALTLAMTLRYLAGAMTLDIMLWA